MVGWASIVVLKCEALRTASLMNTICNLENKSFFLCKYFIGWHLAPLHKDWRSFRDNSSPSFFFPTSFYSLFLNVLLCLNLDRVQLTTTGIYAYLLSLKSSPPRVHRAWAPFLGPDFFVTHFWTRLKDSTDNKMNDLFWLIALRSIKVCDSLPNWGYISNYGRHAVCPCTEKIDHCFVN